MNRWLWVSCVLAIAAGCVPLDSDYDAFCRARPALCYGTGKGPVGTEDSIGGGVINIGTGNADGITIVDAFLGDNCNNPRGITGEVASTCRASGNPELCYYRSNAYGSGDPFPGCSERLKVRFVCYNDTTRVHTEYETDPEYFSIRIDCTPYRTP